MSKIILNGKEEAERIALFLEESERLLGKSLLILQCDGHSEEYLCKVKKGDGRKVGGTGKCDVC